MTPTPYRTRKGILSLSLSLLLIALVALAGCADDNSASAGSDSLLGQIKQRGVVRVGVRVDNPPHSSIDENGKWVGFDLDIANKIAQGLGVRLELVKVDELTRISLIQNGKIDLAVASISKTRKRAQQVDFSSTYFFSKQTFLVRKGGAKSLEDLVGKRVGADRGSSASGNWSDWLKRNGHQGEPDIVLFGDKHAAVDAVKQGAIAGWAEDYEVLASYAKNEPELTVLDDPDGIGVKLDGIAMRKNDSALQLAVNLALQDIAASGEYVKMYKRWFGPSTPTPVPLQGTIEVWPNG
jgi:polar amino acid transport system substrate-binding protein